MSDDDDDDYGVEELVGLRFYLSIERDPDDEDLLNVSIAGIPREVIPAVFSRSISDIVTTTLMGMEMETIYGDDTEDEEEG
jgi:hypothetical protein